MASATVGGAPRSSVNLLVVSGPDSPELSVLQRLPAGVQVVATGQTPEDFAHLSAEQCASVDVLLNCGVGKNAGKRDDIRVRVLSRRASQGRGRGVCARAGVRPRRRDQVCGRSGVGQLKQLQCCVRGYAVSAIGNSQSLAVRHNSRHTPTPPHHTAPLVHRPCRLCGRGSPT